MMRNISYNYSPNYSPKKRISKNIKFIIFHYTGMKSEKKAINRLTDVRSKVSCHYFIKRNGNIILMVPEKFIAWHAGISNWKSTKSLNKNSIGIEIQNNGHKHGYQGYTKKQIFSIIKITKYLKKKYKIKSSNLLGHSDISINRKMDPGEKFPWRSLSKKKLCKWHRISSFKLKKLRKLRVSNKEELQFFNSIKKIGYSFNFNNSKDKFLATKIFQMRFRQELINGKVDQETLIIAKNISKN